MFFISLYIYFLGGSPPLHCHSWWDWQDLVIGRAGGREERKGTESSPTFRFLSQNVKTR